MGLGERDLKGKQQQYAGIFVSLGISISQEKTWGYDDHVDDDDDYK